MALGRLKTTALINKEKKENLKKEIIRFFSVMKPMTMTALLGKKTGNKLNVFQQEISYRNHGTSTQ